jgi:phage-related baseplate assembly protein
MALSQISTSPTMESDDAQRRRLAAAQAYVQTVTNFAEPTSPTMESDDAQRRRLAVAQAYVSASNAHDVDAIIEMMHPEVAYRSTGVGAHDGAAAIRAM